MEIYADWERAQTVFGNLVRSLRALEYPYNGSVLPQRFVGGAITSDPVVHSRFLFYVCHFMRGSVKSDFAIRQLVALFGDHPHFFDPFAVGSIDTKDIFAELQKRLKYRPKQISSFWKENSRRLVLHWNGDPRNIFIGLHSSDGMYERITNKAVRNPKTDPDHRFAGFVGFQKKMASMLHYFLADADLITPLNASPAVDFHLLRIMLATGVLQVRKEANEVLRYEHLTPLGIEVTERYCREFAVNAVELGDALWALSVALCSKAPGNLTVGQGRGETNKRTLPTFQAVTWDTKRQVEMYTRSCGVCPAATMCTKNIPAGAYYFGGRFEYRERSTPPPLATFPLFDGNLPELIRARPPRMSVPAPQQNQFEQHELFPLTTAP